MIDGAGCTYVDFHPFRTAPAHARSQATCYQANDQAKPQTNVVGFSIYYLEQKRFRRPSLKQKSSYYCRHHGREGHHPYRRGTSCGRSLGNEPISQFRPTDNKKKKIKKIGLKFRGVGEILDLEIVLRGEHYTKSYLGPMVLSLKP